MLGSKRIGAWGAIVVAGLVLAGGTAAQAATYTWDASATSGSPSFDGSGSWTLTGSNWWNSTSDQLWTNSVSDIAQFGTGSGSSTAYTVTLSQATSANGLIFQNQAYTISGSTLALGGTSPTITVNASGGTIASLIAGANLVTKTGTGSLMLTGSNNAGLSGGFTVSAGTLVLNSTNGNRPTGTGTLTVGSGATVDASAQANNFGNYNSGTVIPIVINGGTIIPNANDHMNTLTMTAGTIAVGGSTSSAGLDFNTSNSVAPTITTIANASPATIAAKMSLETTTTANVAAGGGAADLLISGAIVNGSTAGGIFKTGGGIMVLTGADTYTAGTTVSQGTLQVGNGGTTGSISGTPIVASGATLGYNLSSGYTATALSVSGNLSYNSGAILALSGTYGGNQINAFGNYVNLAGNTFINAGAGGATITGTNSSLAGIRLGGVVNVTTTGNVTFSGSTSAGSFIDGISLDGTYTASSGTLTFNGTAAASGAYGIEDGVSGAFGGSIASFGNVVFSGAGGTTRGSDLNVGTITGNGNVTLIARLKGLNTQANFTSSGGLPLNVNILTLSGVGISGGLTNGTDTTGNGSYTVNSPGAATVSTRTINAGTGAISLNSSSTLTLGSGAVTLTGSQITAHTATMSITGPVTFNGPTSLTSTSTLTLNGATISGSNVTAFGANTTVSSNVNVNAGAGSVLISGTNSGTAGITSGTSYTYSTTGNVTFSGTSTAGSFIDGLSLAGTYSSASGTLTINGIASSGGAYGIEDGVSGVWGEPNNSATFGNVVFKGAGGSTRNSDLNVGPLSGTGSVTLIGLSKGLNSNATFASSGAPYNVSIQTTNGASINGLLGAGTDTTGGGNYTINSAGSVTFGGRTVNAGTGTISLTSASGYSVTANSSLLGGALVMGDTKAIALSSGVTLTLNSSGTISNPISGATGILSITGGAITLAGSNTYAGTTSISAGTLAVNGSLASGSVVSVGTSATLGGSGNIGGSTNLTGNGTINLSGGTIAGLLSITGGNWSGTGTVASLATANNNTFTIGSGANMIANAGLNVTGGTLAGAGTLTGSLNYTSPASSNFPGTIAGSGASVTLNNSSAILTLSGSNTYTGATNVSAGTLNVEGTHSGGAYTVASGATLSGTGAINGGTVTLNSGGFISPGASANTANVGTLTLNNFSTGGGGTLNYDLSSSTASGNDLIQVNGSLTLNGSTTISVYKTNSVLANGNYSLFDYVGTLSAGSTSLVLAPGALSLRQSGSFDYGATTPGVVSLDVTGAAANLIWVGGSGNVWNQDVIANQVWYDGQGSYASDNYFAHGDAVTFSGSATAGNLNVSLSGALAPQSVTVTGTNNYTFSGSGSIGGPTALTVAGPGSLTISQTGNNYTGGTTLVGGSIVLGVNNGLPSGGTLTMGAATSNGTLDLAGNNQTLGGLSVGSGATAAGQTITSSTGSVTLTYSGGATPSVFAGVITDTAPSGGTLGLTISAGTLDVSGGSTTYSGATTVNGGVLLAATLPNSSIALSSGAVTMSGSAAFSAATGGTANLNGTTASIANLGNAVVNLSSSTALAVTAGSQTAGGINGGGSLTASGTGVVTLGGANAYTGSTTITGGTLAIGGSGYLGGGNYAASIANSGTLLVNTTANETYSGLISGSGNLVQTGTGTLMLTNNNTFAGGTTVNAGTVVMQSGTNSATPAGRGTLTINAGATVIATPVTPTNDNQLGSEANGYLTPLNISGGTFLAGNYEHVNSITMTGGLLGIASSASQGDGMDMHALSGVYPTVTALGSTAATISSVMKLSDSTTFSVAGPGALIVSGAIAGGGALTKTGSGMLILSGADTYSGPTVVSQGTLQIGNGGTTGSIASTPTVPLGSTLGYKFSSSYTAPAVSVSGNLYYASSGDITLNGAYSANQISATGAPGTTSRIYIAGTTSINAGPGGATFTGFNTSGAGGVYTNVSQSISTTGNVTFAGTNTQVYYTVGVALGGTFRSTGGTLTFDGTSSGAYGIEDGVSGSWAAGITTYGNVVFRGAGGGYGGHAGDINLGGLSGSGSVTLIGRSLGLPNNGTFTASGGPYNVNIQTLNGANINGLLGSGTDTTGGGNYTVTSAGSIAMNGRTINAGTGTIALTSAAGYSIAGATTLQSATLTIGDSQPMSLASGSTLTLKTTGTIPNSIQGSGNLAVSSGAITLTNSSLYTGSTTINGGTLQFGTGIGGQDGSLQGTSGVTDNATLLYNLAGSRTASYSISGSGSLAMVGGGLLNLAASNGYSGGTSLTGGVLQLGNSAALGSGAAAVNGGTLDLAGKNILVPSFSGAAGLVTNSAPSTLATLTINQPTATTFSGAMNDGAGQLGLQLTGTGTLTLANANGYSGGTTINAGTLRLAAVGALPAGGGVAVNGLLDLSGEAATVGGLSGSGTVDNSAGSPVTLTVGYNDASSTFAGVLQNTGGSVALTKTGSGNFTLSGVNNYSGLTTVQNGVLTLGASGAVTGPASVTGGTLDASGFAQSIASVSVGNLGALDLGFGNVISSTGTDSFAGTLDIAGSNIHAGELMSYTGHNGTFTTVNGLSNAYQLLYGNTELDIISSGPATWSAAGSGSWNNGTNWTSGSGPSGIGVTAIVGTATNSTVSITLDTPQTLGTLVLTNSGGNAAAGYSLDTGTGGAGSLTLDNSGAAAQITVNVGTHAITAPVYLVGGDLTVSASNSGVLTISGSISQDTTRNLTLNGDGTGQLILSGTNNLGGVGATVTVVAGTLVLNSNEALADGTSLTVGDASFFGGIQSAGAATGAGSSGVGAAISLAPVPEPGTLTLLAAVAAMVLTRCKRRRRVD